jgi:Fe2+ transport system protein FeoA
MVSSNASPTTPTLPLNTWQDNTEGIVAGVTGSSLLTTRLREMGVVPGVRVRILRHTCPMVLQVENDRLCLRRQDAAAIHIENAPHIKNAPSQDTAAAPTSRPIHSAQG